MKIKSDYSGKATNFKLQYLLTLTKIMEMNLHWQKQHRMRFYFKSIGFVSKVSI